VKKSSTLLDSEELSRRGFVILFTTNTEHTN